jgi:hypothetical protein
MPKIDFTHKVDQFNEWIAHEHQKKGRYFVYVTGRILNLRPTNSTDTHDDATIRFDTREDAMVHMQNLEKRGMKVFDVGEFYWQSDRGSP